MEYQVHKNKSSTFVSSTDSGFVTYFGVLHACNMLSTLPGTKQLSGHVGLLSIFLPKEKSSCRALYLLQGRTITPILSLFLQKWQSDWAVRQGLRSFCLCTPFWPVFSPAESHCSFTVIFLRPCIQEDWWLLPFRSVTHEAALCPLMRAWVSLLPWVFKKVS